MDRQGRKRAPTPPSWTSRKITTAVLIWGAAMAGCAAPLPVRPIHSIGYSTTSATRDEALLLLPGRRSRDRDFDSAGFIAAVRDRGLSVEIIAVDAHLGYYLEDRYRDLPAIIHEDVVQPLMRRGFKQVWLVGTSLGSLGAVAYAKKYPSFVAGLLLMGAYLGEDPVLDEIERAGGLPRWYPTHSVGYDYEQRTWQWLKGYFESEARPSLYLAWGASDRFARASHLVAAGIPAAQVFVTPGGHDFETWLALWGRFLDATAPRWL